jgi:hypothetical protein
VSTSPKHLLTALVLALPAMAFTVSAASAASAGMHHKRTHSAAVHKTGTHHAAGAHKTKHRHTVKTPKSATPAG